MPGPSNALAFFFPSKRPVLPLFAGRMGSCHPEGSVEGCWSPLPPCQLELSPYLVPYPSAKSRVTQYAPLSSRAGTKVSQAVPCRQNTHFTGNLSQTCKSFLSEKSSFSPSEILMQGLSTESCSDETMPSFF